MTSSHDSEPGSHQAVPLEQLLGPQRAAAVVQRIAHRLVEQDQLPGTVALRLARERVADGDPWILAAPGQIWELREGVDLEEAPHRRVGVHLRLFAPARVVIADADEPTGEGEMDEVLIEVLEMYELVSWDPAFVDPVAW